MVHCSRRTLLRAGGLTTAGALAGCSVPFLGDGSTGGVHWSVTGGDASRTFSAAGASIPASEPSVSWRAPLAGPFGQIVLARGDRALAGTPAGVHAISLGDGSAPWTYEYATQGGGSDFALTDDGLVVRRFFPNSGVQPRRFGLSLEDGSTTFERNGSYSGSALWAPTGAGLLGLSDAGTVSAFDPASGEWGDPLVSTDGEVWGTIADEQYLYTPVDRDGNWTVEAHALESGETRWTRSLPWDGSVSMLSTGDRLVMTNVPATGSAGAGARGLDPDTGEVVWEFTWNDDSLLPWRGVAAGGTVFLLARPNTRDGSGTYRLAAVDADSGDVRWRVDTDMQFPFAVSEDRLVGTRVTTRFPAPGLVAIEGADGSEAWRLDPGEGVEPGIAVSGGVLAFLATGQGRELVLLS